ncbi:RAB6A-GEF complex partner protein 1 [Pelomyxa schiedti]|nr:RAB6A-GEF complex partner protein 1 [Pelomyxa schiedti]
MYAFGSPRVFETNAAEEILSVHRTRPSDLVSSSADPALAASLPATINLIAHVSRSTVGVWSGGRYRVLCGTLAPTTWAKTGKFAKFTWGPQPLVPSDNLCFAVSTELGYIHIYKLTFKSRPEQSDIGEYITPLPPLITFGVPTTLYTTHGPYSNLLQFRDSLVVIGKDNVLSTFSWKGTFIGEKNLTPHIALSPDRCADCITFSMSSSNMGVFGFVTAQGCVLLMNFPRWPCTSAEDPVCIGLSCSDATCLAFSCSSRLVAVGRQSGHVSCFLVPQQSNFLPEHVSIEPLFTITMTPWGVSPADTGAVTALCWSHKCESLAVAWSTRGISVWSPRGNRYMCSFSQARQVVHIQTILFLSSLENNLVDPLFHAGAIALEWDSSGYYLIVCSKSKPHELIQLPFAILSIYTNPTWHSSHDVVLIGEDRLLLLKYSDSLGSTSWVHLPIPQLYLQDNWPVVHSAMNRTGTHIAVAGKNGVAIYHFIGNRWRLFGNQSEEKDISSVGLCWYKRVIIILSPNRKTGSTQVLMYSSDHLSNSSRLHASELPNKRKPVLCDCNDSDLVIFTEDNFLYQYHISCTTQGETMKAIQLTKAYQISMAVVQSPYSLCLLSPESECRIHPAKLLFLHPQGSLVFVDMSEGQRQELATDAVQFWVSETPCLKGIPPMLWTQGAAGIQLTYPFSSSSTPASTRAVYEFEPELCPVGVMPDTGILLAVTQQFKPLVPLSTPSLPFYEIHSKAQPFLHNIIRHLINIDSSIALSFAQQFQLAPHFPHTLELLLFSVLENYSLHQQSTSSQGELQKAIQFLSAFSCLPEVLMRCARKVDVSTWDCLFSSILPVEIFEQSTRSHKFETASSLLQVILHLNGEERCLECGLNLLDSLIVHNKLDLLADLQRFLAFSKHSEKSLNIVNNHARTLILKFKFKQACEFASCFDIPVRAWLAPEISWKSEDFFQAITQLHVQYSLEKPTSILPPCVLASIPKSLTSLNTILNELIREGLMEWGLSICVILMDVERIRELLSKCPQIWPPLSEALLNLKAQGYTELHEILAASHTKE